MNNFKPRSIVLAIATVLLSGCAAAVSDGSVCPPVPDYTPAFQARMADELDLLPNGGAIEQALIDYAVMRDQARACERR